MRWRGNREGVDPYCIFAYSSTCFKEMLMRLCTHSPLNKTIVLGCLKRRIVFCLLNFIIWVSITDIHTIIVIKCVADPAIKVNSDGLCEGFWCPLMIWVGLALSRLVKLVQNLLGSKIIDGLQCYQFSMCWEYRVIFTKDHYRFPPSN